MNNKIKECIEQNNWTKAFSVARKFFFGIPKTEMRNIEIAADCLGGKSSYYQSLGIDTDKAIDEAKLFLKVKYA